MSAKKTSGCAGSCGTAECHHRAGCEPVRFGHGGGYYFTKLNFSGTVIGTTSTITLPAGSAPNFVATTEANKAYVLSASVCESGNLNRCPFSSPPLTQQKTALRR